MRRFFSEASLIPGVVCSSLSVDAFPLFLSCFLVLLIAFFSGFAGINRGDDGHDSMSPGVETQKTKLSKEKADMNIFLQFVYTV